VLGENVRKLEVVTFIETLKQEVSVLSSNFLPKLIEDRNLRFARPGVSGECIVLSEKVSHLFWG